MSNKINGTKLLIIDECIRQGITNKDQIKYVLATVQHETNGTFEPVREAYWLSEKWRKRNLKYYPYYGRGLVQLTWKKNYKKFSKLLTKKYKSNYIDLVKMPDLVLNLEFSIFILVYGMKNGIFTGKKLNDYITKNKTDFIRARKIINGLDKSKKIAKIAKKITIV
jgi:predicted chitinase